MTPLQRSLKRLSIQQRAVYETICRVGFIRTSGNQLNSCRSLVRTGLIKQNTESEYKNEFILNGEAVTLPVKCSHPLEVVGVRLPGRVNKKLVEIEDPEPEPAPTLQQEQNRITITKPLVRPAAVYDNPSREQRVDKWIKEAVVPGEMTMVKVKCLQYHQMRFVMFNYEILTAAEIAGRLGVPEMSIKLFCQANAITPLSQKQSKRKKQAA